jgi:hypothetical protein
MTFDNTSNYSTRDIEAMMINDAQTYRRMHDVRYETDLQLYNVGGFSIEGGLIICTMDLLQVALDEEFFHDLLGRLNVNRPGFRRIGDISGMKERLQEGLRIGHVRRRTGFFEEEIGGDAFDERSMISHVRG